MLASSSGPMGSSSSLSAFPMPPGAEPVAVEASQRSHRPRVPSKGPPPSAYRHHHRLGQAPEPAPRRSSLEQSSRESLRVPGGMAVAALPPTPDDAEETDAEPQAPASRFGSARLRASLSFTDLPRFLGSESRKSRIEFLGRDGVPLPPLDRPQASGMARASSSSSSLSPPTTTLQIPEDAGNVKRKTSFLRLFARSKDAAPKDETQWEAERRAEDMAAKRERKAQEAARQAEILAAQFSLDKGPSSKKASATAKHTPSPASGSGEKRDIKGKGKAVAPQAPSVPTWHRHHDDSSIGRRLSSPQSEFYASSRPSTANSRLRSNSAGADQVLSFLSSPSSVASSHARSMSTATGSSSGGSGSQRVHWEDHRRRSSFDSSGFGSPSQASLEHRMPVVSAAHAFEGSSHFSSPRSFASSRSGRGVAPRSLVTTRAPLQDIFRDLGSEAGDASYMPKPVSSGGAGLLATPAVISHPFAAFSSQADRGDAQPEASSETPRVEVQQLPSVEDEASHDDGDILPPIEAMVERCCDAVSLRTRAAKDIRRPLLDASTPRDEVPLSWVGWVRAYAKGEMDVNQPPKPRSAPLVRKAVPRSPSSTYSTPRSSPACSPAWPSFVGSTGSRGAKAMRSFGASTVGLGVQSETGPSGDRSPRSPTAPQSPPQASGLGEPFEIEVTRLERFDDEEILSQAQEAAAVGGEGDLRAPRPLCERERQEATREFLEALASDGSDGFFFQSIAERLRVQLDVSYAGVQLLSDDRSIVLAQSGLDEEASASLRNPVADVRRTPGSDFHQGATTTLSRDATLDAHSILSRDGRPLLIPDLERDWRFCERETGINGGLRCYGGAAILASSGLAVGTVSFTDSKPLGHRLDRARQALDMAATEAASELERLRRAHISKRLAETEASLQAWCRQWGVNGSSATPRRSPIDLPPSPSFLPLAPPASSGLAARRGARSPQALSLMPATDSPSREKVRSALRCIAQELGVELAYAARLDSEGASCTLLSRFDNGLLDAGRLVLDYASHAHLATPAWGTVLQQDAASIQGLLNADSQDGPGAKSRTSFETAIVVGVPGQPPRRGTFGALVVATRNPGLSFGVETQLYLSRFANAMAAAVEELDGVLTSASTPSPGLLTPNGITPTPGEPASREHALRCRRSSGRLGVRSPRTHGPAASAPPSSPLPLPPLSKDLRCH